MIDTVPKRKPQRHLPKTVNLEAVSSRVKIRRVLEIADVPLTLKFIHVNPAKKKPGRLQKVPLLTLVFALRENSEKELKVSLSTLILASRNNQESKLRLTLSLQPNLASSDVQMPRGNNTITDSDFVSQQFFIPKKRFYGNEKDKLFENL